MIHGMNFVLDANVFIEAKRRYYAFDLCPGFWEALRWHHARGELVSIDRVKDELKKGKDDLTDWVNNRMPDGGFVASDEAGVVEWYGKMVAWVQAEPQYFDEAKAEFARVPDAWVTAYAKAKGAVLVTHEVPAPDARKKVPIPNVCQEFDIPYIDSFEMLRTLRARFNWERPA
ncbi:DUF4411 family protein [Thiolapillus sp.]|uniref:DUF4411 family protein n=6 Tax=Thiolapillus sp. TaxID=2017437 RepID=UPI0025E5E509|nr:DUF4411 family protein [Thiolapillus sp.]